MSTTFRRTSARVKLPRPSVAEVTEQEIEALGAARTRIAEADATGDLVARFEARQNLIYRANCAKHRKPHASELADVGAWMDEHRVAYDAAKLDAAWRTLPARLRKGAEREDAYVIKFRDRLTESLAKEGDTLNDLSWSVDVFDHAARALVARRFARYAEDMIEKGIEAKEGFEKIGAAIDEELTRQARFQRHRSTSPTSNLAEECERVALAELCERKAWLSSEWSV